eukprot:CAMPEP_0196588486 /NCGR_PEP_ID=MMETSP1081-20130531/60645_1 /TAXON_ID=36882 /ORGANISM="Pyramimonas amylifera, Strain CCMP720" /LENGTH=217 /DNA_ID=CAMNT_0041910989 /DNA_START=52 /DNA_END=705 /DNA_ORIENTATION=+
MSLYFITIILLSANQFCLSLGQNLVTTNLEPCVAGYSAPDSILAILMEPLDSDTSTVLSHMNVVTALAIEHFNSLDYGRIQLEGHVESVAMIPRNPLGSVSAGLSSALNKTAEQNLVVVMGMQGDFPTKILGGMLAGLPYLHMDVARTNVKTEALVSKLAHYDFVSIMVSIPKNMKQKNHLCCPGPSPSLGLLTSSSTYHLIQVKWDKKPRCPYKRN